MLPSKGAIVRLKNRIPLKRSLVWLFASVALGSGNIGCQKKAAPAPSPPGAHQGPATTAAPSSPTAPAKPFVLDESKLERYIQYQRKVILASRDAIQSIARIGSDAGTLSTLSQTRGALKGQGEAIDAAQMESGLSKDEIHAIEPMVHDVTSELMANETLKQTGVVKMIEEQMAHAPPEARAQLEKTLADMKAQQEEQTKLTKERQKYGDANVDVLVSRKDELIQLFKEAMGVLSGKPATAASQ